MGTASSPAPSTLLLVAGAGRSGTSTVTGSLNRLGFVVPQPEVPADESNPRGFYEPQWVVDFHNRIFDEIRIRTNDARPVAARLAAEASTRPELHHELASWLALHATEPRVVVKDPRTFWMHDLWRDAATQVGMELAFLTMLRPPAEVAKSRDTHYLADRDADYRRARETTNVASWCLGILTTERVTRGDRRAFVRYHDLMADWRTALHRAGTQVGEAALTDIADGHHAIDDFIDPGLYRSKVSWEDLSAHPEICEIADGVWSAVNLLVDDPADTAALSALDALGERYDHLYTVATDLTLDVLSLEREHLKRLQQEHARLQRLPTNRVIRSIRRLQRR